MDTFRELRTHRGLSQGELATLSGLRQATISAIEKGHTLPRRETMEKLAHALDTSLESLETLLQPDRSKKKKKNPIQATTQDWTFMNGLDSDLRQGLADSLVSDWTHHSTSLEGNTISAGDTLFILKEGLTISGKSLKEHQEIHGHAQALTLLSHYLTRGGDLKVNDLHQLHCAVEAGADIDIFNPIGAWKKEDNGTMVITTEGTRKWHDYTRPREVSSLMQLWLSDFHLKMKPLASATLLDAYLDIHLGFTAIHPYADGNGRLARLLANLPLLKAGSPPLIIQSFSRKKYITLLGDYTLARSTPKQDDTTLIRPGKERDRLADFFQDQWQHTLNTVQEFHTRQQKRNLEAK